MSTANRSSRNTTFLIDLSKKVYITGGPFNAAASSALLKGDVELGDLGVTVSESFSDGTKHMQEKLNAITAAASGLLKALVSKLPVIGPAAGSLIKGEDLTDNLAYAYTLTKVILDRRDPNDTNPKESIEHEIAKTLNQLFNYIIPYRIPMRESPPSFTLSKPNFTVNFAYGKANEFNAYREVYQPLKFVASQVLPTITMNRNKAILESSNTVPYPQQLFIKVIQVLLGVDKGKDGKFKKNGVGEAFLTQLNKLSSTVASFKEAPNSLESIAEQVTSNLDNTHPMYEHVDSSWNPFDWHGSGFKAQGFKADVMRKTFDDVLESFNKAAEGVSSIDSSTVKPGFVPTLKKFYKDGDKSSEPLFEESMDSTTTKNYAKSKMLSIFEGTKLSQNLAELNIEGSLSADLSSHSIQFQERNKDNVTSIFEVLSAIAQIPSTVLADAAASIYEDMIEDQCVHIYCGFPQRFFTSQQELEEFVKKNYQTLARIKLRGLIVSKESIKYNFENLDENGFPMSGSFKIEDFWNVLYPQKILNFQTGQVDDFGFLQKDKDLLKKQTNEVNELIVK